MELYKNCDSLLKKSGIVEIILVIPTLQQTIKTNQVQIVVSSSQMIYGAYLEKKGVTKSFSALSVT